MVYFHSSISVCNSVDQASSAPIMANSVNSNEFVTNSKSSSSSRNNIYKKKVFNSPSCLKIPSCERSRSAAIDVVILIAVIAACGFLLFPTIKCISLKLVEIIGAAFYLAQEEMMRAPMIYGSIGLGFGCAAIAAWLLLLCTTRKCGNPNCKGLRKAAEFDIQLETEECVKNSSTLVKDGVKKGLFELPRDHHKELEAELKKMAPVNGRAVLVFRARCGCSVGRLEVPGPKKQRKIKK
ncbi:Ribosomal protein L34Ae [Corchorus capsularis]|uniref:Ribosomal protein L34Ae n=1 Tax=Corchorus capsularis TaxID=210143 RepID=A0A1R3I9T1_COCAP|nr:Ribosomal protein L34Ae [Corchorus capsularis]